MARPIDEQVKREGGGRTEKTAFALGGSGDDVVASRLFDDSYGSFFRYMNEPQKSSFPDEVRDSRWYLRENAENALTFLNRQCKEDGAITKEGIVDLLKTKRMSMDERRAWEFMRDKFDDLSTGWLRGSYNPLLPVITIDTVRNSTFIRER